VAWGEKHGRGSPPHRRQFVREATGDETPPHLLLPAGTLPPRSPKRDGAVERAQRIHTEAFHKVTPCALELAALNRVLRAWEHTYNTVRPRQGLG
jgi:transposase InsO family protein